MIEAKRSTQDNTMRSVTNQISKRCIEALKRGLVEKRLKNAFKIQSVTTKIEVRPVCNITFCAHIRFENSVSA